MCSSRPFINKLARSLAKMSLVKYLINICLSPQLFCLNKIKLYIYIGFKRSKLYHNMKIKRIKVYTIRKAYS